MFTKSLLFAASAMVIGNVAAIDPLVEETYFTCTMGGSGTGDGSGCANKYDCSSCIDAIVTECQDGLPEDLGGRNFGLCDGMYGGNSGGCIREFEACTDGPANSDFCDGKYYECQNCNTLMKGCIQDATTHDDLNMCIDLYAFCKDPNGSYLFNECDTDRCNMFCSLIEDDGDRATCANACNATYAGNCIACGVEHDSCVTSADQGFCDAKLATCNNCNVIFEVCAGKLGDDGVDLGACNNLYDACKSNTESGTDGEGASYSPYMPGDSSHNCFVDAPDRLLKGASFTEATMTPELCVEFCADNGAAAAGVEYMFECFCGDLPADTDMYSDAANCNMACSGDASQTCGGGWALEIFEIDNSEAYNTATIIGLTFIGTAGFMAAGGAMYVRRIKTKKVAGVEGETGTRERNLFASM